VVNTKYIKYFIATIFVLIASAWTVAFVYISGMNISTEVANDLAMKQMENTELSSYGIQTYSQMVNVISGTPIILFVLWALAVVFVLWAVMSNKKKESDVHSI
jgi:hypothetical protein